MKLWPPSLNRQHFAALILLIFTLLFTSLAGNGVNAADNSLAETLLQAGETTPELREEREQVAELTREIELLYARAGWQVMSTASYRRGEEETLVTGDFTDPEELPEENMEPEDPEDPDGSFDNNQDAGNETNNDTELESFENLTLGLGVNRAFISGFELESDISYLDRDPIDTDDVSDNLTFSLEGSYQLWPQVPTELDRSLQNLEAQLALAQEDLERAREVFYRELLGDYLEITILQEELELIEARRDLTETRLERARSRREIEEAGELEIRELELALNQIENTLNTLKRNLSTARENFRHKLAEAEEPAYELEAELWQRLEDRFSAEMEKIFQDREEMEQLLERRRETSVEFSRLQEEKNRLERELGWFEDELQPQVDISAGSQDIAAGEWQAAVNVNYAFYQGGRKDLETEDYAAEIESLQQDIEDFNFVLRQEMQALLNEIENDREAVERAELQLERTKLELEQENLAYEKGTVDELNINELELDKQEDNIELKQQEKRKLLNQIELVSSLDYLLLEEVLVND